MEQSPLPPLRGRRDRTTVTLLAVVGGVTVIMLLAAYLMMGGFETHGGRINEGFRFGSATTPAQASRPPLSQPALPQAQPEQPGSTGDSLAFVTNQESFPPVAGNVPAKKVAAQAIDRTREKQFLAQYDGQIKQYQAQLSAIGLRYREKRPIVKEVDEDFSKLTRYMAVKRRYEADRDLYQWARDTASLPEVRTTIRKYLSRPEAWSVAVDMAIDALKQPPPAPIYKEIQHFMLTDSVMSDITDDVMRSAKPNMPNAVSAMVGKDVTPLQQVMTGLNLQNK
ncbi:MAG: hypothetical protein NTY77_13215 [Elusimicrobia bacterium]|nr:hypothetical protein [Elusimicrobiota bacterium]